jgi:hypothetical protein
MSKRDTEKLRNRDTEETKEREDIPPLAARVNTLQEAVQLSLSDRSLDNYLFTYSRALRAFEITTDRRLPREELGNAFALWWGTAMSAKLLPADADFDEWRFDFEATFEKTRIALGANALEEATQRANASPMPPQADRYASPNLKRLVAVCYHLQAIAVHDPFFLSVRDAARILGTNQNSKAAVMLGGLVRDGILTEVARGKPGGRRATRFRFNAVEPLGTHSGALGNAHASPVVERTSR